MSKKVIVVVDRFGEVKIDAQGFTGVECEKATLELEKALGLVEKRQRKPEYHKKPRVQVKQG